MSSENNRIFQHTISYYTYY